MVTFFIIYKIILYIIYCFVRIKPFFEHKLYVMGLCGSWAAKTSDYWFSVVVVPILLMWIPFLGGCIFCMSLQDYYISSKHDNKIYPKKW